MVSKKDIEKIRKYVRATNYLGAIQIYLKENFLLKQPLEAHHIKPRLLGHWGTVPGINFTYANINYLIKKNKQDAIFLLGPGHGFPAIQANLFVEGTSSKYYKEMPYNEKGIADMCKRFSWPYGYPSHANPGAPGTILEGGELGYSLATAYGAVMDNPKLLAVCLIGDGEAETASLATAWHSNKFINPQRDGAVLPILHLNGYKISGPTIFGRMSNAELKSLFKGYGYEPFIVDGKDPYMKMARTLEIVYKKIKALQKKKKQIAPKWPMIILRTLKGWTGIKQLDGIIYEGNCKSHQVIAKDAKKNKEHLRQLEKWFHSYKFEELFTQKGFCKDIRDLIPPAKLCMGQNKYAFAGEIRKELKLPKIKDYEIPLPLPGTRKASSMFRGGMYLRDIFKLNKKNFRLMSPDETYSNQIHSVFEATSRVFMWPIKTHDEDLTQDGRVVEMLSENTLFGMLQGYILTGRHGLFVSYEAFVQIIASMVDQYAKFLKASEEFKWRKPVSSMNIIMSSLGWRQDHNGFSHQNPAFISGMLEKHAEVINVYFPVDANHMIATLEQCFKQTDCINIIVAGKKDNRIWLTMDQAKKQLERGIMIWDHFSEKNPQVVFAATGDYPTKESIAAMYIIKKLIPELRMRFVSISELRTEALGNGKRLTNTEMDMYFTRDKPVIYNYHGYTATQMKYLFGYKHADRFELRGYSDEGSTTTPFDMQVRNGTSRYQLAIAALKRAEGIDPEKANQAIRKLEERLRLHRKHIIAYGEDPIEIEKWELMEF